jgi:hypothetical protein
VTPKTKSDPAATAHLRLKRIVSGKTKKPSPPVYVSDISKAAKKVGTESIDHLRWALQFIGGDHNTYTTADWMNARLEAAVFTRPRAAQLYCRAKATDHLPLNDEFFPSQQEVKDLHSFFVHDLDEFAKHQYITIGGRGGYGISLRQVGDKSDISFNFHKFADSARVALMRLLQEHGTSLAKCNPERRGCGSWFLKSRSDREFCSDKCLNRAMTWERRHPEERKRRKVESHGDL